MKLRNIALYLTAAYVTAAYPVQVLAVTTPSFPSCVNPQGALKVSYDSGKHGIVGMDGERTGSDKVYQLSDYKQLLQCLCPENGNGIQTNWWEASQLSAGDIEVLKKEGWLYVGNGANWGLSSVPYVAKNFDYNCKPSVSVTPAPASSAQQVLSLASTGNTAFLYTLIIAGFVSIVTGLILRYRK